MKFFMKLYLSGFLVVGCLLIAVVFPASAEGQENMRENIFTPADTEVRCDYVAFGLAYNNNFLIRRGNTLGLMFTAEYGHTFSDVFSMTLTGYYADNYYDGFGTLFLTSLSSDLTTVFRIVPGVPFYVGVGVSGRWYSFLQENIAFPMFNLPSVYYVDALEAGANAKIEYVIPVSEAIDFGIRGYGQVFFHNLSFISNRTSPPSIPQFDPLIKGVAAGGIFLRINF
jgi:hypothetical protein